MTDQTCLTSVQDAPVSAEGGVELDKSSRRSMLGRMSMVSARGSSPQQPRGAFPRPKLTPGRATSRAAALPGPTSGARRSAVVWTSGAITAGTSESGIAAPTPTTRSGAANASAAQAPASAARTTTVPTVG